MDFNLFHWPVTDEPMTMTRLTFFLIPSIHRVLMTEKFSEALPYFMPLEGSVIRSTECSHREIAIVKQFWRFLHVKDDWFIAHERLLHWINSFSKVTSLPEIPFEKAATAISDDHPIRIRQCESIPEINCTYGQLRRYISHGARSKSGKVVKIEPIHTPNGMAISINRFRKFIEELQK